MNPNLVDELVLLAKGPDCHEAAEGIGKVGEDGRAADALEALEFSGGAAVEVLQPPVDADHDDGEDDEEGRLDGVDDERRGAYEADENETL